MMLLDQLIAVSNAYCAASRLSRARVATIVFDQGAKLDQIAAGRDIQTRTFEKAMAWFSANWPDGLAWPEGVPRPVVSALAAEASP